MRQVLAILSAWLLCATAIAHSYERLSTIVKGCVSIVRCTTVVKGDGVSYKIKEVWKGDYSSAPNSRRRVDEHLDTGTWREQGMPIDGREIVFFFMAHRLPHPYKYLTVTDGKIAWDGGDPQDTTVEKLKKEVLAAVAANADRNAERPVGGDVKSAPQP